MHDAFVVVHRWLALVTAIFILLIAGTGSALVFESSMDRALYPELWRADGTGASLPLDTLAARASAASEGRHVSAISPPTAEGRALVATIGSAQVFEDPHSGRILGRRTADAANATLPRRLHRLHTQFLVRNGGSTAVALTTLSALVLTLTGLVIWLRDKRWQIKWSASWKRVVFDLHHSLGLFASIVLLIISASGLVIHFDSLAGVISRLDGAMPPAPPKQPAALGVTQTIGFDSAAHVAARALPGAQMMNIVFATDDRPVRVSVRFPEDRTPGGRSRVYIDRFRGTVLGVENTRAVGPGTRVNNVMRSMHTGDVLGAPTRAIWFVCALVLASQGLTGFLMWWNQRSARAAISRRTSNAPTTA
jgi:uncharacterized iron-regulated membrane protein